MFSRFSLLTIAYSMAIFGFVLDQLSKAIARAELVSRSIDLGLIRFDLVYNTGAAYGIFSNFTMPLTIIGFIVIVVLIMIMKSIVESKITAVAYGVILAGACGNTYDRFVFGKVTDFINIQIIPVFNFADMFLNIGIGLLILDYFIGRKQLKNRV